MSQERRLFGEHFIQPLPGSFTLLRLQCNKLNEPLFSSTFAEEYYSYFLNECGSALLGLFQFIPGFIIFMMNIIIIANITSHFNSYRICWEILVRYFFYECGWFCWTCLHIISYVIRFWSSLLLTYLSLLHYNLQSPSYVPVKSKWGE